MKKRFTVSGILDPRRNINDDSRTLRDDRGTIIGRIFDESSGTEETIFDFGDIVKVGGELGVCINKDEVMLWDAEYESNQKEYIDALVNLSYIGNIKDVK